MVDQPLQQITHLRTPEGKARHVRQPMQRPRINLGFLILVTALVLFGLAINFSAVSANANYSFSRQLAGVIVGVVAMGALWRFDYRVLSGYTTFLLTITVVLILMPHLPIIGHNTMGATSWVKLGSFTFQPGEFAKITVILLAAAVVARYEGALDDLREYLKALGILFIPFICIMTQPDLGTGLVYLFIAATALVMGGARLKYLLVTLGILIALVVAMFAIDELIKNTTGSYKLLKQYQRNRLLVFLDQGYNTSKEGYNLRQAMIAIGSGGFFGKGYMQATQSSLGYLPEAPTDFIFCVMAEEFGFIGSIALLGLYAALLLYCLKIARQSTDLFGCLIVLCVAGMWLFQILENVGMDMGLMPITGIPLPFVSYGTSFMLVNFVMIGLILSVWTHNSAQV